MVRVRHSMRATMALAGLLGAAACGPAQPEAPAGAPTEAAAAADAPAAGETAGTAAGDTAGGAQMTAATAEPPAEGAAPAAAPGGRLAAVKERGKLVCGVNDQLPGFGSLGPDGTYSGFDVDFCRAVAAAVLGDAEAVEFRPLTAQQRFTALQTGEVDVLIRNTTWTLSRDTQNGLDFGPTTFYDGQGVMVRKDSGAKTLPDLAGATICVTSGTTTEKNLEDAMRADGVAYTPVVLETPDDLMNTYDQGRCDAVTADRSALVARQPTLLEPAAHAILEATLSKEPLGPAVLQGDAQWADVVRWVVYGTIAADELGITSKNVDEFLASENPEIRRMLGVEDKLGEGLGLANDYLVTVLRAVGNYGQIYDRNLGVETTINLERGLNQSWEAGGLLYSPPFR